MPDITPKVSFSINAIALATMVIGGSVAYGKLQANIEEHTGTVEKLNKVLYQRTGQLIDLQVLFARRDEQFTIIQRGMDYMRKSIDKIADRLEKAK